MRLNILMRQAVARLRHAPVLLRSRDGATAIEYSLIAAMIAMTILGALHQLGGAMLGLPLPMLVNAFESAVS